ncbi:YbbR-like domain-containing protein [Sulfidibacter corallicola]|uniref:YbbR-like domain-containing protein n=1 Tax=Sulfidibacter corallicola TaxID=2818388 RepID=A0A8A4TH72_SULCO|nr:CdaR family protein [Sulfidibacter corallicola]QTD48522.1 YbbR-like domain-containing protein [Sulfidibacter corallicola]
MTTARNSSNYSKNIQKLMALLLALVMWVSMSGRMDEAALETTQVFSQVLLNTSNSPDNMRTRVDNYQLNITLRGQQQELDKISPKDLLVELNLAGRAAEGKQIIALSPESVKIPKRFDSLKVDSIIPNFVEVTFTEIMQKELSLIENVTGKVHPDFFIEDIELNPSTITLEGPPKQLERLAFLTIKPIDVTGAIRTLRGQIQLDVLPKDTITQDLSNYNYRVVIKERTEESKPEEDYPIQVIGGEGYRAEPDTVKLQITGPVSALHWFNPAWVIPEVTIPPFLNGNDADDDVDEAVDEAIPTEGEASSPPAEPDRTMLQITHRWNLPDEIKADTPDWLNRVSRLRLTWTPEEVAINKAPQEVKPDESAPKEKGE